MRKVLLALALVASIELAAVTEAQAISPRSAGRRGRSGGSSNTGSKTSGFPMTGAGLSFQTIKAGRPGWYFPNLGPVELKDPAPKGHH